MKKLKIAYDEQTDMNYIDQTSGAFENKTPAGFTEKPNTLLSDAYSGQTAESNRAIYSNCMSSIASLLQQQHWKWLIGLAQDELIISVSIALPPPSAVGSPIIWEYPVRPVVIVWTDDINGTMDEDAGGLERSIVFKKNFPGTSIRTVVVEDSELLPWSRTWHYHRDLVGRFGVTPEQLQIIFESIDQEKTRVHPEGDIAFKVGTAERLNLEPKLVRDLAYFVLGIAPLNNREMIALIKSAFPVLVRFDEISFLLPQDVLTFVDPCAYGPFSLEPETVSFERFRYGMPPGAANLGPETEFVRMVVEDDDGADVEHR